MAQRAHGGRADRAILKIAVRKYVPVQVGLRAPRHRTNVKRCLLISSWYWPLRILDWTDAVTMWAKGTVDVIAEYDETISSPSTTIRLPAVIRLRKALPNKKKNVKFSRSAVYVRDGFHCMYCGKHCRWDELTYDHVQPRSRGGRTDFENVTSACGACNAKKGNKTCDEAGMWPRQEPHIPKTLPLTPPPIDDRKIEPEWLPFLQKNK